MQVPGLADHGRDGSFGAQQELKIAILGGADTGAAGGSEGSNLRVLELDFFHFAEEGGIAFVGTRPSALDVVEAEIIEMRGDFDLVADGQRDVLGLAAVAESRVVNLDMLGDGHCYSPGNWMAAVST